MTNFLGIIVALVVGLAASVVQIGEAAADDCRPKRRTELTVVFLRNIPLVNVTVNGTPATFLLDTGAERTIMAAAAALRLGLESHYEYPRRMRSLGSAVVSGDARLRSLGLGGGIALADFRVLVGSLSLPGPAGKPLDGLLGADFFSSFEVDLDLAHNRLTLYERLSCAIAAPPWNQPYITMPVNRSLHDHLFFPVSLDGHKVAAFIDTGAEVSAIDAATAMALGVTRAALNHDPVANLRGAGSEVINSRAHRFARMDVADETIRDLVIVVTNLRLQDADLVLGIDFLRLRRVWFSYSSHRIFLARPA